jgi:hypothetical protein
MLWVGLRTAALFGELVAFEDDVFDCLQIKAIIQEFGQVITPTLRMLTKWF